MNLKLLALAILAFASAFGGWLAYRHHKAAYHRHNHRVQAGFVRRRFARLASVRIRIVIAPKARPAA